MQNPRSDDTNYLGPQELPPKLIVSSVWTHQDGKWQEVLYQQTAVENR